MLKRVFSYLGLCALSFKSLFNCKSMSLLSTALSPACGIPEFFGTLLHEGVSQSYRFSQRVCILNVLSLLAIRGCLISRNSMLGQ